MAVERQQDPTAEPLDPSKTSKTSPDETVRRAESLLDQTESLLEAESLVGEPPRAENELSDATWQLTRARWSLGRREIPENQWFRQAAMGAASVAATIYLVYRLFWTLNLASPWATVFSVALWSAEFYAAVSLGLYFFQVWRLVEPPLRRPTPGHTVDVFVTTYNEDVALLRGTLRACVEMDYPHITYVLDDGSREEVRQLAGELGVRYISRADHAHAKAGNINNALRQTNGEFVIILDADHVPYPHFITRLIGHFDDPRMGFVQAPHTTYNLDNFLGRWKRAGRAYWEDVRIFFEAVQLGKNRFGVACFCGSAAIFRRKALEDVGLIATETITEDLHTGMRINAAGWRSIAVGEDLVVGLAPDDAATFASQRLRWGEGNLSVLAYDNPLTMKGLSLAGRLNYLASIGCWTMGPWRLLLYLTPLIMLLTGVAPVADMSVSYFAVVGCYLVTVWTAVKIASNGCGQLLGIEMAMMASFHLQIQALWRAVFRRRRQKFVVTAKRRPASSSGLRRMWPQIGIVVASVVAISWAVSRCAFGVSADYLGLAIGAGLGLYHSWLAMIILARATARRADEQPWRHPICLAVDYAAGAVAESAVSIDLNESGCRLLSWSPIEPASPLELTFHSPVGAAMCQARVEASTPLGGRKPFAYLSTVAFGEEESSREDRQGDGVREIIFRYVVPLVTMTHRYIRVGNLAVPEEVSGEGVFPLPVAIDPGLPNMGVQESVAMAVDSEGFFATLETPCQIGSAVQVTIRAPFGPIVAEARVSNVEALRVGVSIVYQHEFRWGDGSVVRSLVANKRRWHSSLTRSVARSRSRRVPLVRRAALQLAACVLVAVTILLASEAYRSDRFLVTVARGPVAANQRATIESQLKRLAASSNPSPGRLLRIYDAAASIGDHAIAAKAAEELAQHATKERLEWMLTAARQLAQTNDPRAADAAFDRLLAQPMAREFSIEKQATVYVEAARAAVADNHLDKAVDRFLEATELTTTDVKQAEELLGVLIAAKRTSLALNVLRQLDQSEEVLERIVDVHEMANQPEAALPELRELLRRYPHNARVIRRLAEISVATRDFAAGVDYYRTLHELNPEDERVTAKFAETLVLLARQEYAAGHYDKAFSLFDESFHLEPPDAAMEREFAGLLANRGRFAEAAALLEPLADVDSRLQLAAVLEMGSQRKQALSILLDLEKSHILGDKGERSIARLLLANREYAQAADRLVKLWNRNPSDPEIQRELIDAVAASGEWSNQVRTALLHVYRRHHESRFEDLNGEEFARLGDALRRLGLYEQAGVMLEEAVDRFPQSRRLRFYLAQTLGDLGRYDDAEAQYRLLLATRPPHAL